ncbi:uncharacterized protein LOC107222650 [Neodiprion lecontei]|uniref:Uncharacterized protein LOC107222650 n=1 Tax=Neodiprion lecontei TaxID=441921 RepID=A0A6J0BTD7_NEOLC|nr:uncharacterized protein LOC107222650 [Neodiprion lecontei]
MGKTIIGKCAVLCTAIGFITLLIAFTTPNWIETDGTLERPKLVKIGLWQVCFQGPQDMKHFFESTRSYGCFWVFEDLYYDIFETFNIKMPSSFIAAQFFFTLSMTLLFISGGLATLFTCCSQHHNKYQLLLQATGSILLLAGVCEMIAIKIFVTEDKAYYWLPDWEHNVLSWSFILAAISCVFTTFSGVLFFADARRHRITLIQIIQQRHYTPSTTI